MKQLLSFFTTISSFLLIGVGGYGIYLLLDKFLNVLSGMKSEIVTAAIIAVIAGVVSVASLICTKIYEASKERESALRERKVEVYENVIKFFLEVLRNPDTPMSENEMKRFMFEDGRKMFTWGSDPVVKIFSDIRRGAVSTDGESDKDMGLRILRKYEDLIFEIRKDLGYKNKDLKKSDFLVLYINDVDKVFSLTKQ